MSACHLSMLARGCDSGTHSNNPPEATAGRSIVSFRYQRCGALRCLTLNRSTSMYRKCIDSPATRLAPTATTRPHNPSSAAMSGAHRTPSRTPKFGTDQKVGGSNPSERAKYFRRSRPVSVTQCG